MYKRQQLYISFFPTTVDAVSSLEHWLEALQQWMQENGLRLNPGKTEVLWVGTLDISSLGNSLSFGGGTLTTKSEVWVYIWTRTHHGDPSVISGPIHTLPSSSDCPAVSLS